MKLKSGTEKVTEKLETNKYIHDLRLYETIKSFGESICTWKINVAKAEENQGSQIKNIVEFNNKSRPISKECKDKKKLLKTHMLFTVVGN